VAGVVVIDGVEIDALEAEVQETRRGVLGGYRVELDELMVVDLDEGLVGDIVFAEVEGLFESELLVEGDGGSEVVNADRDMGDAIERWGVGVGLSLCGGSEEGGQESNEQSAWVDLADARGRLYVHSLFLEFFMSGSRGSG
jgi:hypothetical protein